MLVYARLYNLLILFDFKHNNLQVFNSELFENKELTRNLKNVMCLNPSKTLDEKISETSKCKTSSNASKNNQSNSEISTVFPMSSKCVFIHNYEELDDYNLKQVFIKNLNVLVYINTSI